MREAWRRESSDGPAAGASPGLESLLWREDNERSAREPVREPRAAAVIHGTNAPKARVFPHKRSNVKHQRARAEVSRVKDELSLRALRCMR